MITANAAHVGEEVILSEYLKVDKAYKAGMRAGKAGKPKETNPYPRSKGGVSFTEHDSWFRGWLAGRERKSTTPSLKA
jgi:ribosome modulation factor